MCGFANKVNALVKTEGFPASRADWRNFSGGAARPKYSDQRCAVAFTHPFPWSGQEFDGNGRSDLREAQAAQVTR
jgi:hypothetical protein